MLGVFLDTETTGLNWSKHNIFEIAFSIINLFSGVVLEQYETLIQLTKAEWDLSDPKSLEFTGITWQDLVSNGKRPEDVCKEITTLFTKHGIVRKKAVFICQNPTFDRIHFSNLIGIDEQERLLMPYIWLDLASMHWAKMVERGENLANINLSKDAIAEFYHLSEEKKPHRAFRGRDHLIECYEKVVGFPEKSPKKQNS